MSEFDSLYQRNLYLSPDQQDLLVAALSSQNPASKPQKSGSASISKPEPKPSPKMRSSSRSSNGGLTESPSKETPGSGHLEFGNEESPFLDFDLDVDFDASGMDDLIGDLPDSIANDETESREKRKSIDESEPDESGNKRRESEDRLAKKPGRKPLTSEPTTKRKAQNRAAQRAFRERKEKHVKDLEIKVEELEKRSESTGNENTLLRAQVERLQVELKEYRKRISWFNNTNNLNSSPNFASLGGNQKMNPRLNRNEFSFDFPKFGDLPGSHIFNNNGSLAKSQRQQQLPQISPTAKPDQKLPGIVSRKSTNDSNNNASQPRHSSSPTVTANSRAPKFDVRRGVYGDRSRSNHGSNGNNYTASGWQNSNGNHSGSEAEVNTTHQPQANGSSTVSNSGSPASSESQQGHTSSICTSPEPSLNSPPIGKQNELNYNSSGGGNKRTTPTTTHETQDGEKTFCEKLGQACGCADNPIPPAMSDSNDYQHFSDPSHSSNSTFVDNSNTLGLDWLVQQNGGQFDPSLFNDYREPQDAILSQDLGSFFTDAFPFPDLPTPQYNFDEQGAASSSVSKKDPIQEADRTLETGGGEDEEVVPGDDPSQMMTCTKIWDRLQTMEKFRNGEIDVDNLCTELRTKARCSEGGVVLDQRDVDDIMAKAK